MQSLLGETSGHIERPASRIRIVLFGVSPDSEPVWRAIASQRDAECVIAATCAECAAYTAIDTPSVIVTPAAQQFETRLVDQTDETFGLAAVVVECQQATDVPLWRLLAWDAIVTPANERDAVAALESAVEESRRRFAERRLIEDYRRRHALLTPNELRVLESICNGRLNKQIASELGVSVRTVEQRRRRVFEKMGVDSAVPLAALRATVQTLTEQARRLARKAPAEQPAPVATQPACVKPYAHTAVPQPSGAY